MKFKSAFKTGLARCPAPPPCSRYCRREIPPGSDRSLSLQHSREASDGFPSSTHFFQQRLGTVASSSSSGHPRVARPSVRPSVSFPSPRKFLEQTRHQIVTTIIGQDTRGNVANDVTVGPDAFRFALKLFSPTSRGRFNGPATNESHPSREKASVSITSRLFTSRYQLHDIANVSHRTNNHRAHFIICAIVNFSLQNTSAAR